MREPYPDVASVETTVDDHFWRNWMASFVPVSRMPVARAVFDNAVEREAIDPEFATFLRPVFESQPLWRTLN
jgi:hypothetical protein